jgi:glycosyltransferase involved in cell wall biosynthesis
MLADAAHPARGSFVRDQVVALRSLDGVEVELHEFAPGPPALARAAVEMRRRYGGPSTLSRRPASSPFDVVHAHFGLAAWPALAVPARVRALTVHGTDLHHPRTRLATRAVLGKIDLLAAASEELAKELSGREVQVLPCGVDLERFRPLRRGQARAELGLDPRAPYLLFPSDPSRPEKRYDRARSLAQALNVELLALGAVEPEKVPLWVNAANAVIVPSEREGFGLAVLEALACDVPVLATPVGIHASALENVRGALCAPFDVDRWRAAVEPYLRVPNARVDGQASAARFSARTMAERVAAAWRTALSQQRSG